MPMTALDRLAWRCSWVAPRALAAALVVVVLDRAAALMGVTPDGWRSYLPIAAVVGAGIGLLAHLVVQYHVFRSGGSSRSDESRPTESEQALQIDLAYLRWRNLMREEHPELRPARKDL